MNIRNRRFGMYLAGIFALLIVGFGSAYVATWRANNKAEAKYWENARNHVDQLMEIHAAYQNLILEHNLSSNRVPPSLLLNVAEQQLKALTVAGDFAGFMLEPTQFIKLGVLFKYYGTTAMYDGFLKDTNPVTRAMGLYCYARTDSNKYSNICQQYITDRAELRVYTGSCMPHKMTLGEFAQSLHDKPDFLWDNAPLGDFPYLKSRVLLGDATPEMFE